MQADFFVQAPGGLMAVEAKNRSPTSVDWAQKLLQRKLLTDFESARVYLRAGA
jgi:hypothetical protein